MAVCLAVALPVTETLDTSALSVVVKAVGAFDGVLVFVTVVNMR